MCLSTVYIDDGEMRKELMRDVGLLEAEGEGFYFIDLFGEKKFFKGVITRIDFVDEHVIILKPWKHPNPAGT